MHREALTSKAKLLWPDLKSFPKFYLAGGTALALQIGHRLSVDFDLFSDKKIARGLLAKIKGVYSGRNIKILVNNPDELTLTIDDVKFTFLYYPYRNLYPHISYQGVKISSLKDIAINKAYTIGRRGSYKDYIDLYFLIKQHKITLLQIITMAQKKYKDDFNAKLFLEQLLYWEDIDDLEIIFLKQKISKKELKNFFLLQIKKISKTLIS